MKQTTFVMVKPDGVQRGLVGEIIRRFERKGLKIVALRMRRLPRDLAERHYAEHRGKDFFDAVCDFVTSGPVVTMAVEGVNAISRVRKIIGATSPDDAEMGSIRGDFASSKQTNLIHGSDGPESAARELALFFEESDYCRWSGALDSWVASADEWQDV